jgi:hypothetical protein
MPLMLAVIVAAARWIVRYRLAAPRLSTTLSVGVLSLGIILFTELGVGMWLRGMSATEVFLNRDPVSGTAYYVSLLLFAAMPALLARLQRA